MLDDVTTTHSFPGGDRTYIHYAARCFLSFLVWEADGHRFPLSLELIVVFLSFGRPRSPGFDGVAQAWRKVV